MADQPAAWQAQGRLAPLQQASGPSPAASGADHRRLANGALRVALLLVLAKCAGALKEMAVAWRYGVSDVVDAYQFTFTLASWLPATLVGGLAVVLIPALVREKKAATGQAAQGTDPFSPVVLAVGLTLAVLTWILWPLVLETAGRGLSDGARAASAAFMPGFALLAPCILLAGVAGARLRARERHVNTLLDGLPALAILVAVLLWPAQAGTGPLLWGALAGFVAQALWLQLLARRTDGLRPGWTAGDSAQQWAGLWQAAGIMILSQIVMSFVGPLDQITVAQLGDNANAVLGYASRLLALGMGVAAASVGRAALPVLADIHRRGHAAWARRMALMWSGGLWLAGASVALLAWWLAPWAVALLYERGAFTAQDTEAVAQVLRWGLGQLPFYCGVLVLVQLLASQRRYGLMAAIAVANFALKAVLNAPLADAYGPGGVMLASTAMYALSFLCYLAAATWSPPPPPARDAVAGASS